MDVKPQDMDEILNQKIVDDIFKNENKGILTIKKTFIPTVGVESKKNMNEIGILISVKIEDKNCEFTCYFTKDDNYLQIRQIQPYNSGDEYYMISKKPFTDWNYKISRKKDNKSSNSKFNTITEACEHLFNLNNTLTKQVLKY